MKPHLLVAARNYCSLRSLLAFKATTEHALDNLAAALFAIDRNGVLVHANRPGDEILRDGIWLSSLGGRLCPGTGLGNAESCAAAIRDLIAGTGATVMLVLGSSGTQRVLLATPIATAPPFSGSVRPSAIGLLWLLPDRPSPTAVGHMARLFELTPAESRLLGQLAGGAELRAAADALGISVHTARNELEAKSLIMISSLRRVYRKGGAAERSPYCHATRSHVPPSQTSPGNTTVNCSANVVEPAPSDAVIVYVAGPLAAVGVPLIAPLVAFKVSPGGSAGETV